MIRVPTQRELDQLDEELKKLPLLERDNHRFARFFSYADKSALYCREVPVYQRSPNGRLYVSNTGRLKQIGTKKLPLRRRQWIESYCRIRNKDGDIVPFILNAEQRAMECAIVRAERTGLPARLVPLKPRQVGISTYVEAVVFETAMRRSNARALVVAHDDQTAAAVLSMADLMKDKLPHPEGERWKFDMRHDAKGKLVWESPISAELTVQSAKKKNPGIGVTLTVLHACLTADTPIIGSDGRVVRAADLCLGERVVTHLGNATEVTAITSNVPEDHNGNGRTIIVTPWLGGRLEVTPNHPIYTRRGFVMAGNLTLNDRIGMPVRVFGRTRTSLALPEWKTKKANGSGRRSIAAGCELPLNEETGFALGYYLAEGSLLKGTHGRCGVSFTRHRNEKAYADRAVRALDGFYTSRRTTDRKGRLSSEDTIYGSPLARMIETEFGATTEKRIPDWVFECGLFFLRGLLAGYLSGDGSKVDGLQGSYRISRVSATSICSSIATQIRDVAAVVVGGWANIAFRKGGRRGGRNSRDAWIVQWAGRAARELRALMGLDVADNGRARTEKSELENSTMWCQIRKIEEGHCERVYDIEVAHPDHSFRTLHGAVKNSETAKWEDAERKAKEMLQALPTKPGTFGFMESTAQGDQGYFHNLFVECWEERHLALRERKSVWAALFFPWFLHEEYRYTKTYGVGREITHAQIRAVKDTITQEEEWLLQTTYLRRWSPESKWVRSGTKWRREDVGYVKVSFDQLLWRRAKIQNDCNGDPLNPSTWDNFFEDYPALPEQAFLASGRPIFDAATLRDRLRGAREPIFRGEIVDESIALKDFSEADLGIEQDERKMALEIE